MSKESESSLTVCDRIHCSRLTPNSRQKRDLCTALGHALAGDPFSHFVYESEQRRRTVLPLFLETFVNCSLKYGHVDVLHTDSGEIVGGALWMGPRITMVSPADFIRQMLMGRTLLAAVKLGMAGLVKIANYGDEVAHIHRQSPSPHYYLSVLGVVPEYRGKGLGATVLAPTIELAHKEKLSVYTESTNSKNLTFYARQGFNRFYDGNPASGPPFYAMQMFP